MKVLFVQNIEGIAGSEKYFWQLLPALKSKGVEVEFLCVHKKEFKTICEEFASKLITNKIPVHFIQTSSYVNPLLLFKMNRLIKKNQFDILHTHLIYADFWSAVLKKYFRLKAKTISTLHGYQEDIYTKYCLEPKNIPKNRYFKIARFTYKKIDHVYSCSEGLKHFFEEIGIRTICPIDVIHHGFDYSIIETAQFQKSDYFKCCIVGRLIPRKGHEMILKNVKHLAQQIDNFQLEIVGDGPLKKSLELIVSELKIEKSVSMIGAVADARIYMGNSDLVLVPSYAEGLPLVIFEAMSVGKAVVAFDTIGPAEVVLNNETGYLIPPFDDQVFCDKIIDLFKNRKTLLEMGEKGKIVLTKKFSLEKMTNDTLHYYQICLK